MERRHSLARHVAGKAVPDRRSMIMAGHEFQKFVAYPIAGPAPTLGEAVINWIAEPKFRPDHDWRREDWNQSGTWRTFCPGSPIGGSVGWTWRVRPAAAKIVMANRANGPEQVMQLVEQRAPQGFDRIEDVLTADELDGTGRRDTSGSRDFTGMR